MHIVVIGRAMPNVKNPLLGIFERDQACALAALGHRVTYIALDLRSIRRVRPLGIKKYQESNLEVLSVSVPLGRVPKRIFVVIGAYFLKKAVNKYIDIDSVDVVHAHFTENAVIAARVFKPMKKKVVITEHSSAIKDVVVGTEWHRQVEETYRQVDALIAVSRSLGQTIQQLFQRQAYRVFNVLDIHAFSYIHREPSENFTFVTTGNLIPGKAMDLTIRAFAILHNQYKNFRLSIIGDGTERENLQSMVYELGVEHEVTFYGRLNREKIAELYADCQVFVLPSYYETFGVVFIEAMVTGLPVIASRCGGPEDYITEKNGILVECGSLPQLVQAMEEMYIHYKRYQPKEISDNIQCLCAPSTIAHQLEEIYRDIS